MRTGKLGKAALGISGRAVVCAICVGCGVAAVVARDANAQVMMTQGGASVSESGAASYAVPIAVPPGIGGMEPKLSLVYNSQGGNGLLGMGWSLQGMSAITRCPQTIAQDNRRVGVKYDADDRFCLDGQRLVLATGSFYGAGGDYRTERESFVQVIASTATYGYDRASMHQSGWGVMPANFVVKTKAGLTMEYGNTPDSLIRADRNAPGAPTGVLPPVIVWALNKVTDTVGNSYTVTVRWRSTLR